MDTEQPLSHISTWDALSSPTQRADGHSVAGSSTSIGRSSLDTASASPHLERYEPSWSFEEVLGRHRVQPSNRLRAFTSVPGQQVNDYDRRRKHKNLRPLAGASRRRLVAQIQELTEGKAELQARLEAMTSYMEEGNNTTPRPIAAGAAPSSSVGLQDMQKSKLLNIERPVERGGHDMTGGNDGVDGQPERTRQDGQSRSGRDP